MPIPKHIKDNISMPVIGAPLFLVSGPDLVIAQCKAGIIGSFPALNARPQHVLEEWIIRIKTELAEYQEQNPDAKVAPFAVNQICHGSNDRLMQDMETCVKHEVPIIITSLRPPSEVVEAAHSYGGLDVLVSTTIVEVGVDVANATLMVIENASRLGLAQLHQLRGRIGRGHAASDCILLSQASDRLVSKQRLAAMKDSQDGFFLAEQDLKIRGPGDVLGTRQSGEESFRLVDLATHSHLISRAIERGESLLRSETIDAKQEIIGLLSTWNRKQQQLLRA